MQIFVSTSLTPSSLSRTHLAPLLQTSNVVPESPGIRHQLVDEGNRVPLGLLVLDGSRRVHLFALSGFLGHTPRLQPTWAILAIVLKEGGGVGVVVVGKLVWARRSAGKTTQHKRAGSTSVPRRDSQRP